VPEPGPTHWNGDWRVPWRRGRSIARPSCARVRWDGHERELTRTRNAAGDRCNRVGAGVDHAQHVVVAVADERK
jgi:hypothetical protein